MDSAFDFNLDLIKDEETSCDWNAMNKPGLRSFICCLYKTV